MTAAVEIPGTVTICVTSCGRLDLLAETLASFRRFNTGGTFLIHEDSRDDAIIDEVRRTYPWAEVISSPERMGLMASIDRLYSTATTPYIFHLEDDWQFDGPVNWKAAIRALETHPEIANVSLRAYDEIKEKFREKSDPLTVEGVDFRLMRADAHPEFFGWSSNPGLITKALYESYAPFAQHFHDKMSAVIKQDGKRVAYLLPGVARHIGQKRNVTDPTMPPRPKSKLGKLMRSIRKKLYYAGLRKDPF
ncbi:glycosyltransferase [Pannonibacter phragmitetus]|uniref:glycosyltransferase n=1 Tax=Pannonibacter phragmitetus TaxID=121719 RepID=UPI000F038765|nr:glycosyltransferase [Pannonibacter phragmitetus]